MYCSLRQTFIATAEALFRRHGIFARWPKPAGEKKAISRFDVFQHAMRANHFTVIEEWQTAKTIETHAAATHTKEYRNSLGPIAGSPLDERLYKVVE